MDMIKELSKPLNKEDLELRVANATEKGFTLLLYKTARTDVNRLNNVCGLNWRNEHFYDKENNLCCKISIFNEGLGEWVTREDVGTESATEKEKGAYSDSFKRAGTRFGIGVELYTAPFIYVSGNTKETKTKDNKTTFTTILRTQDMEVTEYGVEDNRINKLKISYKGKIIYSYDNGKSKTEEVIEKPEPEPKAEAKPEATLEDIMDFEAKIKASQNLVDLEKVGVAISQSVMKADDKKKLKAIYMDKLKSIKVANI